MANHPSLRSPYYIFSQQREAFPYKHKSNLAYNVGINDKLISLIKGNKTISAKELSEQMGISSRQCERIISTFKEQGIIERRDSKKSGYWVVKSNI